jgi:hypothetical protein
MPINYADYPANWKTEIVPRYCDAMATGVSFAE